MIWTDLKKHLLDVYRPVGTYRVSMPLFSVTELKLSSSKLGPQTSDKLVFVSYPKNYSCDFIPTQKLYLTAIETSWAELGLSRHEDCWKYWKHASGIKQPKS